MCCVFLQDGDASGSPAQPQQSISGVISRLRRKLAYPSQNQTRGDSDVSEREHTSPLPEMPDLSETTASLSSNSSAQVFELPKSSQVSFYDSHALVRLMYFVKITLFRV